MLVCLGACYLIKIINKSALFKPDASNMSDYAEFHQPRPAYSNLLRRCPFNSTWTEAKRRYTCGIKYAVMSSSSLLTATE